MELIGTMKLVYLVKTWLSKVMDFATQLVFHLPTDWTELVNWHCIDDDIFMILRSTEVHLHVLRQSFTDICILCFHAYSVRSTGRLLFKKKSVLCGYQLIIGPYRIRIYGYRYGCEISYSR